MPRDFKVVPTINGEAVETTAGATAKVDALVDAENEWTSNQTFAGVKITEHFDEPDVGTFGNVFIQPEDDDTDGILIKRPSADYGAPSDNTPGNFIRIVKEDANDPFSTTDTLFRVAASGGVGTAGWLHVATGAHGSNSDLFTAAWIEPFQNIVGLTLDKQNTGGAVTADMMQWRVESDAVAGKIDTNGRLFPSRGLTSTVTSVGDIPILATGVAGQTAALFRAETSDAASYTQINATGKIQSNVAQHVLGDTAAGVAGFTLTIRPLATNAGALIIKPLSGQTLNTVYFLDSANASLASFNPSGEFHKYGTAASTYAIRHYAVTTHANATFQIRGDGRLEWGAGNTSAVDTNLSRGAADRLQTTSEWRVNRAATTDRAMGASVTGDAAVRWVVNADGKIEWGDGTNARDVLLYRSTTNVLKTDDQFIAADGVQTKYLSGAGKVTAADGDFTATPPDGTLAVVRNTTDSKVRIFARANGSWVGVEAT